MSNNKGRYGVAVMLGAIFYWLISGRKRPFQYYESPEFESKNLRAGYLLQLAFVVLFILAAWLFLKLLS